VGPTDLRPWQPRPGDWNLAAATHLSERAGFGPGPGEAQALLAGSVADAVTGLFEPRGHELTLLRGAESLANANQTDDLGAWWLELMRQGGDPLGERLTLMWHDHFATSDAKVKDARLMYTQNQLFRELGRGDFRVLVRAVAKDACMLVWLDGDSNRKGQPNENFAREVMELFVLGIGNYTERDVKELSRALSGWGTKGRSFHYRERYHDEGEKQLFGRVWAFTPEAGLELVLAQPAALRHVARRILVEFVGDRPPEELVEATAQRFEALEWNVGALVREVLASAAFFTPASRRCRIAGPVELVVRAARRLASRAPSKRLASATADMGQRLFFPPSVKGWDGGKVWIHAGTWTARHNALLALLADGVDLFAVLGRPRSSRDAARVAVEALMPAAADSPFAAALCDEVETSASPESALATATALIVVSPEYHLI